MKIKDLKIGKINITWYFLIGFVFLGLTILGIFLDTKISDVLMMEETKFGSFLEDYGELPGYSMLVVSIAIMGSIFFRKDSDSKQKLLAVFCSLIMVVAVAYLLVRDIENDFGLNFFLVAIFLVVVYLVVFFLVDKEYDELELFKIGLLILFISILSLGLNGFLFSNLFYRAKPSTLLHAWSASPTPIYEMTFMPFSGYESSFVSGHATSASLLLTLPIALNAFRGNKKIHHIISVICSLVYIAVVYLASLIYGSHYFTDLTIASLLVVIFIILSVFIASKIDSKVKTE